MDEAKLQELSLPELAAVIESLEGLAWDINHDAADARIEAGQLVNTSLAELKESVGLVARVFAAKAGINLDDILAMRERITIELGNYDALMKERWQQVAKVGAVFKLEDALEGFTLEVVAVYTSVCVGSASVVFCRVRGTGEFTYFQEGEACRMTLLKEVPLYSNGLAFVRAVTFGKFPDIIYVGQDIRESGAVFRYYAGGNDPRNGVWETFYVFYRHGEQEEHIVVARNQNEGRVAEFTAEDLPRIKVPAGHRRFVTVEGYSRTIPVLDIT